MNARTKTNTNVTASRSSGSPANVDIEVDVESGTTPASRLSSMGGATSGVGLTAPAPLTMPFAPGDVIAEKYQIIGLIGAGGVAFVVAAMHLELGEMVALKFLRPESLAHEEVVARFATEARAAARIKSEHVCRVYDVGSLPDGAPFIVMEYLEGKDLCDVLRAATKLPIKVAVDYVMQACEALACAHAAGIVHRDVKPENLFLTQQATNLNVVKVLDFGISKTALAVPAKGTRRFAKTMMPMGTPAYMSPEQIRASNNVDARTDIWALGCVLFELVTGACAFDAPTLMQLGAAILERDPIPLRKVLPEAPAGLEGVITKCLAKNPEERYQNVAELAADLYPYGPRRARISAERCSQILQSGGALVELSSVAPPPPAVAAAIAAIPAAGNVPSLPVAVSMGTGAAPSTAMPASISVADASAMRPKSRFLPIVAFGLVAAAAGAFGLRLLSTPAAQEPKQSSAPVAAAPPAQALPTDAQPVASTAPARSAEVAAEVAPPQEPSASAKTRPSRPRPVSQTNAGARREVPLPAKARPAARTAAADDEPDVGY